MVNTIILRGKSHNNLSISLYNILIEINDFDSNEWKFLWLEGISYQINMLEFEKQINSSINGYLIGATELLELSKKFSQLNEIVLIGGNKIDRFTRNSNDDMIKNNCNYFIELIDSSYWEITSKHKDVSTKLLGMQITP